MRPKRPRRDSEPSERRLRRRGGAPRTRRGSATAWLALLVAVSLVPVAIGLATSSRRRAKAAAIPAVTSPPATPPSLTARPVGHLPFAMQRASAAVVSPQAATLLGGLDASDASRTTIQRLQYGKATLLGTLPTPVHDASAASIGPYVYLFGGGGETSGISSIVRVDPNTGSSQVVGSLPQPSSDLSAAVVGDTAYVVGGYTGQVWLDTILAWRPGSPARVVGRLPQPLRYAAVTAVSNKVLIAGGDAPNGPSGQVLEFDPKTGQLSPLATLPRPLAHAAAAELEGFVYLIGGRATDDAPPTREILSVDPRNGATAPAGQLPQAVSDVAAAALANTITVAGGRTAVGAVDDILQLTPVPAPTRTP